MLDWYPMQIVRFGLQNAWIRAPVSMEDRKRRGFDISRWLKKMGYRLVLRRFEYPAQVRADGKLAFAGMQPDGWHGLGRIRVVPARTSGR